MKNILLPTDFSDNSWNAIEFALNYYSNYSCVFYLLHVNRLSEIVLQDSPYLITENILEDTYTKPIKAKLNVLLRKIKTKFGNNTNHRFYSLIEYDFFVDALRKVIEEKHVDHIVMGTKGATGLNRIILGSNTADVIAKVKCTTLVIPEKAHDTLIKEIVFPTDFSIFFSAEILNPLLEMVHENYAHLRILHFGKQETGLNNEQRKNKEILEDFFSGQKIGFHFLSQKNLETGLQYFVEHRNIDIIAMVAKNLNYFQQIFFNTKVEKISYRTKVPFLVLHE
jgi:nucleotide-binding universal stress UspA family protein